METNQEPDLDGETRIERLRDALSPDRFREWYYERQHRQNIENGTPYFNGPSSVPDPDRHSPSRLLKCHRKVFYQQCNAPEETSDPDGIFWFGTKFEENIAFPFLERAVTDSDTYVQNSVWVDFQVETTGGELQIKGETDPLIVDTDAIPVLPTEIKTKSSVEHITSPNQSHRAQLHAYMVGLSEKYECDVTEGAIIYGSRESLDIKVFHVEFDEMFWRETVLDWAQTHTTFRVNATLPPANPEQDWECGFCPYQERCGQGKTSYEDVGPVGVLPTYEDYPRRKLKTYFEAYPAAKLPPTLTDAFPDLAADVGVYEWRCTACGATTSLDTEGQHEPTAMRACPACRSRDIFAQLQSPSPDEQTQQVQATEISDDA